MWTGWVGRRTGCSKNTSHRTGALSIPSAPRTDWRSACFWRVACRSCSLGSTRRSRSVRRGRARRWWRRWFRFWGWRGWDRKRCRRCRLGGWDGRFLGLERRWGSTCRRREFDRVCKVEERKREKMIRESRSYYYRWEKRSKNHFELACQLKFPIKVHHRYIESVLEYLDTPFFDIQVEGYISCYVGSRNK